ncbi:MAG: autotransporter outer membrane beta-barrel domain-containing protein [Synergistaceae bacterium]|nr:autotransporter outer membrane beta-barrel domain-containing protein [Synergistaceae bacterium]
MICDKYAGYTPPSRAKSAAMLLAAWIAGLAILSAFIFMNAREAEAATLFISGGGAGQTVGDAQPWIAPGEGGEHASGGLSDEVIGFGGGAYVGDGTNPIPADQPQFEGIIDLPAGFSGGDAEAGNGQFVAGGVHGGNALFTVTETIFEGWDIRLEGGQGSSRDEEEFRESVAARGGDATFEARNSTVVTDSLTVISGRSGEHTSGDEPLEPGPGGAARAYIGTLRGTAGGDAAYTFVKNDGELEVEIGALDATRGDVTFTVDGILSAGDDVSVGTLDLGGGNTFILTGLNNEGITTGDLNIHTFNVRGEAAFEGHLDAEGKIMNFYLPHDVAANYTMLTIKDGIANIGDATVHIHVGIVRSGGSPLLQTGDRVILINAVDAEGGLTGEPANRFARSRGKVGSLLRAEFEIDVVEDEELLVATLLRYLAGPGSEMVVIGNLADAALVTKGADLIAGPGIAAAVGAEHGHEVFAIVSAGKTSYDTSPSLDLSSTHLVTGVSRGVDFAPGRLTFGPFFEYASGSYDTQGLFDGGLIRSDGDVRYVGGGVLARMDFNRAENALGRFYAEASGRAGSVRNEFNSFGLDDILGNNAQFTSESTYFGLHTGLGYSLDLSERSSLDFYGKYFWTRIGGDSVLVSTGEHVNFQDVNSHRLRFGGRFSHSMSQFVRGYVGAAWEHEFDGKAGAFADGYSLGSSSLSGSTGIGELGLLMTPSPTMPLFIDLGIQGYTGSREGVTGRLEVRWEF